MINAGTYHKACKLKKVQVFAISMKNLEYQIYKEAKLETDLKSIVSKEYHNFLNLFF